MPPMSKAVPDPNMTLVQVKRGAVKMLWDVRPRLRQRMGGPTKAALATAAFHLVARLVKAKRFTLNNRGFVECKR